MADSLKILKAYGFDCNAQGHNAAPQKKRVYSNPEPDAEKTLQAILSAQWIDGPPDGAEKYEQILVFKDADSGAISKTIWSPTEDSLKFITDFCGPIIKHMRLPEYE